MAGGAVAVRAVSALTLAVVAPDGARNLRMARLILQGEWTQALTLYPVTHPLYAVLIAPTADREGASLAVACAISAVLGGLAVLPLFFLVRATWNDRVATVAAVLYTFLPSVVELHCDAMLEGAFFFFFFFSMAAGWSALERRSWERAVLAGASAACAWLTRPEGAYLIPLFGLACLLRWSRFVAVALPAALLPALVLALPYATFVKAQTGRYAVSASPFSAGILGLFTGETKATGYSVDAKTAEEFSEYRDISRFGKVGGPIVTVAKSISKNLFHVLVQFVLIGFAFLRTQEFRAPPGLYLLAGAVGYFLPAALAFVAGTPFSHRYILVPCVLLLAPAAVGLLRAAAWLRHPRALVALLGVIALAMAVRDVRFKRDEKAGLKLAGRALLGELGPHRRILAMSRQVEFYARGVFVEFLPRATFADVEKLVVEKRISAIALFESDFRNVEPGMQDRLGQAYRRLGTYAGAGKRDPSPVVVYLTGVR